MIDPLFTLCNQASNNERQVFSCNGRSAGIWFYIDCHYHNLRMLTQKGVCEQAEHVTSPQEMEYDVTMKTRTNLCRNIGVHTQPLNGVSIRIFYNTEAEKTTTSCSYFTFGSRHFHFQFSFRTRTAHR